MKVESRRRYFLKCIHIRRGNRFVPLSRYVKMKLKKCLRDPLENLIIFKQIILIFQLRYRNRARDTQTMYIECEDEHNRDS